MNFNKSEFYKSFGEPKQLPESNITEIVFSGRSNVGKSSLINKIVNKKSLARTSSVPGKTATINFYKLDNVYLADLPGYGYAKVSHSEKLRWSRLIEGYFASERNIGVVIQLIDYRHPPSSDDLMMIDFLIDNEFPFIIALTKADKLKKSERAKRMEAFKSEIPCFDDITVIEFSAQSGEGADIIREIISDIADEV